MSYFKAATDASDLYRPSAAAASTDRYSTAVTGNLSDMMRNATIFRATFIAPVVVHINNPTPDINARDTYGAVSI